MKYEVKPRYLNNCELNLFHFFPAGEQSQDVEESRSGAGPAAAVQDTAE